MGKYDNMADDEAATYLILDVFNDNAMLYPGLVDIARTQILLGNPKIDALLLFAKINAIVSYRKHRDE